MASYYFDCVECDQLYELVFGMNDDEGRNNASCPECEKKLKRVFTIPNAVVKGTLTPSFTGKDQHFVDCDGRPVRMNFMDHGDRSGLNPESPAAGIPGSRICEKTGKAVMDVVSSIPDPLGALERSKKKAMAEGRLKTEVRNVNAPVKKR
jgi:putative FmdB family regulatory protein